MPSLRLPLRLVLLGCALYACVGTAFADEGGFERRLDQAWRDAIKGNGKPFLAPESRAGSKTFSSKNASVKEFYYPKRFSAKEFLTGNFKGSHNFWMGDFKYDTKTVDTRGRVIQNVGVPYATKAMPVQTSQEASKGYTVRTFATRANLTRGKSQDKFDKEGPAALAGKVGLQGNMQTMTIDQVRDLLNKSK